jgi:hypothetical protein
VARAGLLHPELASAAMPSVLDTVRHEWEEGYRRLQAAANDHPRYERLLTEVDLVLEQLRRRVGQTFTLDELARAYGDADRWVQETFVEFGAPPGWPARAATAQDAAFHLYARGAVDYRP